MRGKLGLLVGIVAVVLAAASAAAADAPTVTITPWERTRVVAASLDTCPFDILVHSEGTFRETVFSDSRDVTTVENFHITWSNPANGKTLKSPLAGPFVVEPNADGTVTVTIDGNNGRFTAPGYGLLFADVGRLVYVADPSDLNTPLQILQSTGHQDPNLVPDGLRRAGLARPSLERARLSLFGAGALEPDDPPHRRSGLEGGFEAAGASRAEDLRYRVDERAELRPPHGEVRVGDGASDAKEARIGRKAQHEPAPRVVGGCADQGVRIGVAADDAV